MSIRALNWALRDARVQRKVHGLARSVLIVLADHADRNHEVWISIARLSAESGWGETAVEGGLAELERLGCMANVGWRERKRLRRLPVDAALDLPVSRGSQQTDGKTDLPATSPPLPRDLPATSPPRGNEPEPKPDPDPTIPSSAVSDGPPSLRSRGGRGREEHPAPVARAHAHEAAADQPASSSMKEEEKNDNDLIEEGKKVVPIRPAPSKPTYGRSQLPKLPLDVLVELADGGGELAADAAAVIAQRGPEAQTKAEGIRYRRARKS
jgi:hypothetical protein